MRTLRLHKVLEAHELAPDVEGLTEEELESVRALIRHYKEKHKKTKD